MKQCIVCKTNLTGENTTWYRQKNYIHKCNDCTRTEKAAQQRALRERSPDLALSQGRACMERLKRSDPVRYTAKQQVSSARKRATALSLPCDLTIDYVVSISPTKCPAFGTELKYGGGQKTNQSPALDKIDPALGYVVGNVQVISHLANMMKSSASDVELQEFAHWVMGRTYEKISKVARS